MSEERKLRPGKLVLEKARRIDSPSGNYYMVQTPVEYEPENGRNFWNTWEIDVFRKDGTLIGKTSRNYSSCGVHAFLEELTEEQIDMAIGAMELPDFKERRGFYEHLRKLIDYKGQPYLLISENYHGGHGVIDLLTGKKYVHEPERGKSHWCWASFHEVRIHEGKLCVVINGCFWGGDFSYDWFDFSNPTELPWKMVYSEEEEYLPELDDEDDEDDDDEPVKETSDT